MTEIDIFIFLILLCITVIPMSFCVCVIISREISKGIRVCDGIGKWAKEQLDRMVSDGHRTEKGD